MPDTGISELARQYAAARDAALARVADLEAAVRDLVASANLVQDSAAAIVDRAPIDRMIELMRGTDR
jgi:hypothetical protein